MYDIMGRKVGSLVDEKKIPGNYETEWNAAHLAPGIYLCTFRDGMHKEALVISKY
jgi:hypothetical protein